MTCRYCGKNRVNKAGVAGNGTQRYRYLSCARYFLLQYGYNGNKPRVADKIIDMALNGSGVRDPSRVLKISQNTVIRRLKKLAPAQVTRQQKAIAEVTLICKGDEQWSFVGSKRRKHWLGYAFDTQRGKAICFAKSVEVHEKLIGIFLEKYHDMPM